MEKTKEKTKVVQGVRVRQRDVGADVPTVCPVELKGYEYARVETLARLFDVSKRTLAEKLALLCETHEVRVQEWGPRTVLVNVADFYRALFDVHPVRNGLEKGV